MKNPNPSHDGRNHGSPLRDDDTQYAEHKKDVVSDPAQNDEIGQDWTDEGGAMPEGPATHPEKPSLKDEERDEDAESHEA